MTLPWGFISVSKEMKSILYQNTDDIEIQVARMPGLVRKLLIFSAVDGLVLQPLEKGHRPSPTTKIAYRDNAIIQVTKSDPGSEKLGNSFEAFGVVGLLKIAGSRSFLISITRRQQVAQIQGKAIYVITEIALTPLASKAEAETSIAQTHIALQKRSVDGNVSDDSDSDSDSDSESDAGKFPTELHEEVDDETQDSRPSTSGHNRTKSVAEDVITRKGSYGRFTAKFFSKKGWNVDSRRNLGLSTSESDSAALPADVESLNGQQSPKKVPEALAEDNTAKEQKVTDVTTLLPKLLRTTQILFASRSFFFSYDYDITRSFANRRTTASGLPLHTEVDPLFFWNRHVIQPFIDAGQSSLVLPLLQGFIGQHAFVMDTNPPKTMYRLDRSESISTTMEMKDFLPDDEIMANDTTRRSTEGRNTEKSFLLTLISRRTVKRAGLRYLRRGVDEQGHAANEVETEQILSSPTWDSSSSIHSFMQLRGSIPVYFSQTPYSFKPIPQLHHSADTNYAAFRRHFENISARYGKIQVAMLVEKHGNEAIVGEQYEKNVARLNAEGSEQQVGFEWFDFHAQCRGMKFENVSILVDSLGDKLDAFGQTVFSDGKELQKQSGVLRTNCMDCLDRTNVVQSACGRRALDSQLKEEGIDVTLQINQTGQFFNMIWADNGDAISKQYTSTAALKGDFTRTKKRDYKGALTDMGLSISRFYSGIVNDYFSQAAIDFLLGNVTALVFEDFDANMMSSDPGVSMQKLRQQAIDESQKICIADEHEEFIGGWTLLAPYAPNTIKSTPFEETVLLLTDSALYATRFNWNIEKVLSFERVDLAQVLSVRYGTYVTSTLSTAQADEKRNVGFVITYKSGANDMTRIDATPMSTSIPLPSTTPATDEAFSANVVGAAASQFTTNITNLIAGKGTPHVEKVLAWKALPARSAIAAGDEGTKLSEIENVKAICAEINRVAQKSKPAESGTERTSLVKEEVIISLADARKSTGLLEQLGHSLKKLVWA
ncbi:SacI homology domain-containing protein, partial [Calycina marina]